MKIHKHLIDVAFLALVAPIAAAQPDVEAEVQAYLEAGEVAEALGELESALAADPKNPRLAYLQGVALERNALRGRATQIEFHLGEAVGIGDALTPSTSAWVSLLTKPDGSWDEPSRTGTTVGSPLIDWCTPAEERYPEGVYVLADHMNLIRWGPLNLRTGEVAVPGQLAVIQRYAMARLATQAQYLDPSALSALLERLEASKVQHASELLDLYFENARSIDFWLSLAEQDSEEDWLLASAAIGTLATGAPAEFIVPTHNKLVERYPLLARTLLTMASQRGVRYDRTSLRTTPPAGPLKVRLFKRGGRFVEGVSFEVIRESSVPPEVVLAGTTARDGSFTISRTALVSPCVLKLGAFRAGRLTAQDNILRMIEVPELVGSPAPDCALLDLDQNAMASLSQFQGKVVYLDFWATWCGPCQKPMADLEQLAAKEPEAWKDRVALLAVSVDQDRAKLESHLNARGWRDVQHLWAGPNAREVQELFHVTGIPDAFLLDPTGRVVWAGHPKDIDVAESISELLAAHGPRSR